MLKMLIVADGAARTLAAHPEWWLRNASGSPMHNLDSGRPANESWLTYDHTVSAAASAWRDACLNLTSSGVIDACYVDGVRSFVPDIFSILDTLMNSMNFDNLLDTLDSTMTLT